MELHEIGKLLKEERLRQGMELSAVAKVTRIGVSALQAIEEGNESVLPSPVYIKGFVRNYARVLKLDLAMIDDALKEIRLASGNAMWSPTQSLQDDRTPFTGWNIGLAALTLLVLVGVTIVLVQIRSPEQPALSEDSGAAPSQISAPRHSAESLPQPDQEPASVQPPPDQPLAAPMPQNTAPTAPDSEIVPAEQNAEPIVGREAVQGDADIPPIRPDMSLRKAELMNMRLTLRPENLRAEFEVHNLTEELLSGQISISFISKDNRSFPALGQEETPQYRIRNFRLISTPLHLPPDLDLTDVTQVQFVATDSAGTEVLVKTYPVS